MRKTVIWMGRNAVCGGKKIKEKTLVSGAGNKRFAEYGCLAGSLHFCLCHLCLPDGLFILLL